MKLGVDRIYAALAAANYSGGGYGDWYLPSFDELNLMYTNLHLQDVGSFTNTHYWSSTETNSISAIRINFASGSPSFGFKKDAYRVRAVRAF